MFSINPKSIKYLETSRGVAYTADLMENNKKVGTVENTGQGGATFPNLTGGLGTTVHKRLEACVTDDHGLGLESYLEELMDKAEDSILNNS
jgi:hypothetical protein